MHIRTFSVTPRLPERLAPLLEIAHNLWWVWNPEAVDLFRRIDHDLWSATGHNPVALLGRVDQDRIESLARDPVFVAHMDRVAQALGRYLSMPTWVSQAYPELEAARVAYFSMEFGIHECLPVYAGGLGVLAGDHLKSASELGLPFVGVGLLYRQGYFHQYLTHDGWQQEVYPENDVYNMPLRPVRTEDGAPVEVEVRMAGRPVRIRAWRAQVGRIPLYLLDTNLAANDPADRAITHQLYAPGEGMRIRQEVVLGVGGVRLLEAVGVEPAVCHMNEGHSAFLGLERIRVLMERTELSFAEALEAVRVGSVFTTHTPVPAGIDLFRPPELEEYLGDILKEMGIGVGDLMALGRENPADPNAPLSMAVLALRLSGHRNGVSRLHGRVSRRMWAGVWPGIPEEEVPIGHVTNGIHVRSWLSDEMARLFDRYLGPSWVDEPLDQAMWKRVHDIPDNELWRAQERLKERLVGFVRRRLRTQLERRGAKPDEVRAADEVLDPEALTIGFARRFATYKRAVLLFRDPERLARILNHPDRPVQILFAGKAHPADNEGKKFIQEIVHHCRQKEFRNRVVFLEDYDVNLARYLVQGCDVWLNTPRRPLEACGTSGMKVVPNGGLHLSVLDGWWDEAYDGEVGWAIGHGEEYQNPDVQDRVESLDLYDLLENEVVPLYYTRGDDGLPRGWIQRTKTAMERLTPVFNTNRMVREYAERYYLPALSLWTRFAHSNHQAARALARWKARVREAWAGVRVAEVWADDGAERRVGDEFAVRCLVHLNGLAPEDVQVEAYYGLLDPSGHVTAPARRALRSEGRRDDGAWEFAGQIPCERTGRYGYVVRVLPHHPNLTSPWDLGLVVWG
ncbi:MAG: glycosyltransferase family 1 protein [Deltaproteobacteria bacterium]|nr:glycosyltransferase family 1 protein [Deltaproteobacteria bacterium]